MMSGSPCIDATGILQVLFWKKRGEEALQRSGIPYTVVRPGGLLNESRQGQPVGGIIMEGPGTFGLPPRRGPGSILRTQVRPVLAPLAHQATCMKHTPCKDLLHGGREHSHSAVSRLSTHL